MSKVLEIGVFEPFYAVIGQNANFLHFELQYIPTEKYSEQWRFAVGAKLGAIIHLNEKFGLVLQTQLMVPVQGVGFGVGCGGGGCGSGATTTSTATQLGFTGGLEIKLNK